MKIPVEELGQSTPKIILGCSISISLVIIVIAIVFSSDNDPLIAVPESRSECFPDNFIHIEFQMLNATLFSSHPWLSWVSDVAQLSDMTVRLVSSRNSFPNISLPILHSDCDTAPLRREAICALDSSYRTILPDFPEAGWIIFASEDVCLNLTNMRRYIHLLTQVADPYSHLVMRWGRPLELISLHPLRSSLMTIVSRALIGFQLEQNLTFTDFADMIGWDSLDVVQGVIWEDIIHSPLEDAEPYLLASTDLLCTNEQCPPTTNLYRTSEIISSLAGADPAKKACLFAGGNHYYHRTSGRFARTCTSPSALPYSRYSLSSLSKTIPLITAANANRTAIQLLKMGRCTSCGAFSVPTE
jgi:hypothetical protein